VPEFDVKNLADLWERAKSMSESLPPDFKERAQVEQAVEAVDRLRLLDSGMKAHIGSLIWALGVAEED
jgi:hypothetical protein